MTNCCTYVNSQQTSYEDNKVHPCMNYHHDVSSTSSIKAHTENCNDKTAKYNNCLHEYSSLSLCINPTLKHPPHLFLALITQTRQIIFWNNIGMMLTILCLVPLYYAPLTCILQSHSLVKIYVESLHTLQYTKLTLNTLYYP